MGVNDDPNSGYAIMYSGKPSKPGRTQQQIGYGLVEGDGVGLVDNADSTWSGAGEWDDVAPKDKGLTAGKRRRVPSKKEQS